MDVYIDGQRYSLDQADLIGAGGEGNVFKKKIGGDDYAVKVYHQPSSQRAKKLEALLAKQWQLPLSKIAFPTAAVYDKAQNVIGLSMPFLGSGFEELTSLANKKYRGSFLINTKGVTDIFLDGATTLHAIHKNGLCVGDFNDLNALFRGKEMLMIDCDAWQFDKYPCPVGTEQFLAPELYGIDLSLKPVFKPEHDWYAYAVLLFKSLLFVHPYGGTHKGYKQITARAKAKVTVFDPSVKYPTIAVAPDLLDDTLAHTFDLIFGKGQRMAFPTDQLQAYANSLAECPKCKSYYPQSRKQCPICSEQTLVVVMKPTSVTKGATVTDFVKTTGKIVFSRLIGNKLFVIAYENGAAVLYEKQGNLPQKRRELFKEMPGAKFELFGDNVLVVAQPHNTQLLLLDLNSDKPQLITRTETTMFAGNRRAMFRASNQFLFRIVAGNLMYGEVTNGMLVERTLRSVMNNQTWFTVRQETDGGKPAALGFFQVMNQRLFWLVWDGRQYDDLPVSAMEAGETLLDITVKFSSQGAAIRRLTQHKGVDYLRTDLIDSTTGRVTYSSPRVKAEDHPAAPIHGQAYSTGKLLHATDEGVIQEKVETGEVKTFDATKGIVAEGDTLYAYQGGLLVVKDANVLQVTLG